MVAVEARRVREQSELAETGGVADGFYCSIFLVHLGVSNAQHKLVSHRLWQSKAAHRLGPIQVVLLVGWVDPPRWTSLLECVPLSVSARLGQAESRTLHASLPGTQ